MYGAILNKLFLGNRVLDYLIAFSGLLLGILAINIFVRVIIKRIKKISEKTTSTLDDFFVGIIEKIGGPELASHIEEKGYEVAIGG